MVSFDLLRKGRLFLSSGLRLLLCFRIVVRNRDVVLVREIKCSFNAGRETPLGLPQINHVAVPATPVTMNVIVVDVAGRCRVVVEGAATKFVPPLLRNFRFALNEAREVYLFAEKVEETHAATSFKRSDRRGLYDPALC